MLKSFKHNPTLEAMLSFAGWKGGLANRTSAPWLNRSIRSERLSFSHSALMPMQSGAIPNASRTLSSTAP